MTPLDVYHGFSRFMAWTRLLGLAFAHRLENAISTPDTLFLDRHYDDHDIYFRLHSHLQNMIHPYSCHDTEHFRVIKTREIHSNSFSLFNIIIHLSSL